ncbi:hypothetical protein BKA64DRAFT_750974 [Cadophora sp. MPI-SDFR-AT-0126]|nr:hypothetical protein BKA64DRAFT_750974 [Leotiomycetes sp. MPI-SDFR-AT-0126]
MTSVIVVGAGPVGLFLTYSLAKRGIHVDLVERFDGISKDHRAAGYYGGAVLALNDAGLLQLAAKRGYLVQAVGWRAPPVDDGKGGKTFGRLICHIPFDHGSEKHPELGMLIFPQAKLCELLEEQIIALGQNLVTFHFGHEIAGINQTNNGQTVTATIRDSKTGATCNLKGDFLVGADGGKSATRNLLGITLQGHTWPERLIALDVRFALQNIPKVQLQFITDPIWYSTVVPLEQPVQGKSSLWRFSMAVDPKDDSPEEVLLSDKYLAGMLERHMVGPRPLEYEVTNRATYNIHQRLANTMAPMGALGLSTGILDAEALGETLQMIIDDKEPITLLETFSHERRKVFQNFVDPTSRANKLRMQQSPEDADGDWVVRLLQNPTDELLKDFFTPYVTVWRSNMRDVVAKEKERMASVVNGLK